MEKLAGKSKYILIGIILLSFLANFWGVWSKDMLGDEASYAFRSVGWLDYLGTSFQTQPVEWYKDAALPFWTKLSFHDHPPLVFAIQHLFFRIFGDNLWSARLPSAVFSALAVWMIYLLVKELFAAEGLALLSAFIFGLNKAVLEFSRTALMEPVLIFFILLNIYFFLKFIKNEKFWWIFGATLGLAMLAKYSAAFLVVLYFLCVLLAERRLFKSPKFYLSFAVAVLLFSPVLIYNFYLFQARGHFDLQLSYLFGQATPEWSGLLGKEQAPFADVFKNLWSAFGWDLIIFLFGFILCIYGYFKSRSRQNLFLLLYVLSLSALLVKAGSATRFLVLFVPVLAVFGALAVIYLWNFKADGRVNIFFKIAAAAFVTAGLWASFNANFIKTENYGIAELDNYLSGEFAGLSSAAIPETDNPHFNEIIKEFAARQSGKEAPILVVYNDNVSITTLEWVFLRRFFYHAIPSYYVENFFDLMAKSSGTGLKGFTVYFVNSSPDTLLNSFKAAKTAGDDFEKNLKANGLSPVKIIRGNGGAEMFRIYKFVL